MAGAALLAFMEVSLIIVQRRHRFLAARQAVAVQAPAG
jgi:hypothetical protein